MQNSWLGKWLGGWLANWLVWPTFLLNPAAVKRYLVGMQLLQPLADAGFTTYLVGPSALDVYFGRRKRRNNSTGGHEIRTTGILWVETEASLVDLSRIFDGLDFPGAEFFDAVLDTGQDMVLFRCIEPGEIGRPGELGTSSEDGGSSGSGAAALSTLQGSFRFELCRRVFLDPFGSYPYLRERELKVRKGADIYSSDLSVMEAALLIARFGYKLPTAGTGPVGERAAAKAELSVAEQRFLLTGIMTGAHTAAALQFLMEIGFIASYWPLLVEMDSVHHSKEHHPEGNVWTHTLETFSHRKVFELELGLGLLLHDCGKPYAQPQGGNRFDQHAQIGSYKARDFLQGLRFPHKVVESVQYLVHHHMMPAAITALPTFRTEEVMASSLFPELLELYRCDVSSTFRGPDGYYRACKTYRTFLKNKRNPFRTSDGKKRLRLLVE